MIDFNELVGYERVNFDVAGISRFFMRSHVGSLLLHDRLTTRCLAFHGWIKLADYLSAE